MRSSPPGPSRSSVIISFNPTSSGDLTEWRLDNNGLVIDCDVYERLFRSPYAIRVELNWDAVRKGKWPVDAKVIESMEVLDDAFFPWYLRDDGREVAYSEDGAKPVGVSQVSALEGKLSQERKAKILAMRRSFEAVPEVQLVIPAYSLKGSGHLILDGCHRLAALAGTDTSLRMLLLTLRGPIDPEVLPDLRHWSTT